jgi:hypothetical protein
MATAPPMPKSFEDARLLQLQVEKELERICSADHFRTSKRACEFLRYVVLVALDGRVDSLKERSIGIDLLGRDTSYDPSSDAIVRVRANDVRKRLSSYYASVDVESEIQINLQTGTYIPKFLPGVPVRDKTEADAVALFEIELPVAAPSVPALSNMTLMRPALLALLLCVLLMRHRLEYRESYLRFWDHILSGRNLLLLSIAPQDEAKLAPSLYPIAWIAGRYGVDTSIEDTSRSEIRPEQLASVQESLTTPPAVARDKRVRWIFTDQPGMDRITDRATRDRISTKNISSAALLTVLPEDTATLHIQGTDSEAIGHLLEELTSQKHFPEGVEDQLSNRHLVQVLLLRTISGQWQMQIFSGEQS